jgi:peptide/nickel transport system ATP-binding protein
VVAELADEVAVMYSGRIVEHATAAALFAEPQHPYTIGLLGSIPRLHLEQQRLLAIEGQVPDPMAPVNGCSFHPRCPFAVAQCRSADPPFTQVRGAGGGHRTACWEAPLEVALREPA